MSITQEMDADAKDRFGEGSPFGKALGRELAEQRQASGLSQAMLGERVGYELAAVSRWERGHTPPLPVLLALDEALGLRPGTLLSRTTRHRTYEEFYRLKAK